MTIARDALDFARKDLRVELRTLAATAGVVTLAGASLITVGLLLGPSPDQLRDVGPAITWIALLFAALSVADRLERVDRSDDVFSALWLAVEDRRALYLGRVMSLTVLLTILQAAIWAAAIVLLDLDGGWAAALVFPLAALTSLAAATAMAIISPLVAVSAERVILLPVLLVPLLVPTILAGGQAANSLFIGPAEGAGPWVAALAAEAALLGGVGLLTYDEAARPG